MHCFEVRHVAVIYLAAALHHWRNASHVLQGCSQIRLWPSCPVFTYCFFQCSDDMHVSHVTAHSMVC